MWWVEALSLYENDREVLLSDRELTDNIINASQYLLSQQFPQMAGLQDTVLGRHLNFKQIGYDSSSVQILHTGILLYVYLHVHGGLILKPVIITL